jgi:SAM-dependent methyltransferase
MEHAEEFVRTGRPVDFHAQMTPGEWEVYQRGQRAHAVYSAPEVARRCPAPRDPRRMLDIGGAHGHYSVALCRRYPDLRSTILDLPPAIEQAAPLVAREAMGERVAHRTGDALTDDLGAEAYDLVFIGNLVHHFDESANRGLIGRVARALRPGGFCVILEIIRGERPEEAGQIGALTDFFFAVTSAAGTWSFDEMADWQRAAGLTPRRPIRLRYTPGYGLQAARK